MLHLSTHWEDLIEQIKKKKSVIYTLRVKNISSVPKMASLAYERENIPALKHWETKVAGIGRKRSGLPGKPFKR